jgi:hypothetical protein
MTFLLWYLGFAIVSNIVTLLLMKYSSMPAPDENE